MLRFIAKRYAKAQYRLKQEVEAATNDLNAGLASRLAAEKRDVVSRLNAEADEMEARIKQVSELEEKGFYSCENGHESMIGDLKGSDEWVCSICHEPAKFIKRDQMTGQEKYLSDKERKQAEKVAEYKRQQAKAEEENAANGEKTAQYFRGLAENNRSVAERVRRL